MKISKISKIITTIAVVFILSISLNSCMTTKTPVGEYQTQTGEEYKYSKGKQLWIFWGLVPLGRTNVNTPSDGNCEVITKFTIGDALISTFTFGIITSYTINVKAKK